jgi:hypothetical protein
MPMGGHSPVMAFQLALQLEARRQVIVRRGDAA